VTELVTGEAVILDVPVARFPSRMVAALLDMIVQLSVLAAVLIAMFLLISPGSGAVSAGLSVTAYALVVIGYTTAFETLSRGLTLGKMAFGLRVVSDDGSPERFRQALVRSLTGLIEIWSLVGAPIGLLTSIFSAKGKRLGDMFAGTYVIQERAPRRARLAPMFTVVPPPLLGWAQVAQTARLSDETAEAAGSYLRRFYELTDAARADLGQQLAAAVLAQVSPPPPPGTPPAAFLAAVLAIRRDREQARLASGQRLASEASRPDPAAPGSGLVWPPAAGAWSPGPSTGGSAWPAPGAAPGGPFGAPAGTAPVASAPPAWPRPTQPGTVPPGTARPGFAPPGTAPPGFAPPGTAPPDFAPPGTAPPDFAQPGTAPPGAAMAEPDAAGYGFAPPG
jgi:uncharacterized RDD family membrane protein YckC